MPQTTTCSPTAAGRHAVWSSATAAPPATGPSTPSPPTSWPPGWAPTSSSPTWCRTKDHVLVARHENGDLRHHRRGRPARVRRPPDAPRPLDGVSVTGWFTDDFTLAELKTLRAVERLPAVRQRNTLYNGLFEVPTFQEVLDLRARLSAELRPRRSGSTRRPSTPPTSAVSASRWRSRWSRRCAATGWTCRDAPVFVQSFEAANLRDLRAAAAAAGAAGVPDRAAGRPFDDPRTYADYLTPAGLAELAEFVDGIGPDKNQVIPRNADGSWARRPADRRRPRGRPGGAPVHVPGREPVPADRPAGRRRPQRVRPGHRRAGRPSCAPASTGCSPTRPTSACWRGSCSRPREPRMPR